MVGILLQSFQKVLIEPPKKIFAKKSKWVYKKAEYKTIGKNAKIITKKNMFKKTKRMYK